MVPRHLLEQVHALQHDTGAVHDAIEWVFGHLDRQVRLVGEQLGKSLEQRTPTRQEDSVLHQVGREFGFDFLEHVRHRVEKLMERGAQPHPDVLVGHRQRGRREPGKIPPADLHAARLRARSGAAERHLDSLSRPFSHEQAMGPAQVFDDALGEHVPGGTHRGAGSDPRKGNHRDVGRSTADVDDATPDGGRDVQSGADGGGDRLLHEEYLAGPRPQHAVPHRPTFHRRDSERHTDHHAGGGPPAPAQRLLHEVADHPLGSLEIGDHPVLHGADGLDVVGGLADHVVRLDPDRFHPFRDRIHGHHGRLAQNDPRLLGVDQGVGGPEVYRQINGEETE